MTLTADLDLGPAQTRLRVVAMLVLACLIPAMARAQDLNTTVDQEVRMSGCATPVYPDSLKRVGVTGSVQLRYVVEVDGTVDSNTIMLASSTNRMFERPARTAILTCHFSPAMKDGHAIRHLVEQVVRFTLPKRTDSLLRR